MSPTGTPESRFLADAGRSPYSIARAAIDDEAGRLGLEHRAWLDRSSLLSLLSQYPSESYARYGLDSAGGAMVAALAFDDGSGQPESSETPPLAMLGRFARANWYAELRAILKSGVVAARKALSEAGIEPAPSSAWRGLANSGLPERPLAVAAGLGSLGRSGLLLVPGAGPGVVIGVLVLPSTVSGSDAVDAPSPASSEGTKARIAEAFIPGGTCGACRACVDACPTAALSLDGAFDRERCIQHWASRAGFLPADVEARWGQRLYGCDACTEACPRFSPRSTVVPTRGLLGPGLSALAIA